MLNYELNILHLEDNPSDAELIRIVIEDNYENVTITQAQNKNDFISELEQGSFSIVLSDYDLPTINGEESLQILRSKDEALPFVLISGAFGEEQAVEIIKQGATDFVLKSNLERLPRVIQRAIAEYEKLCKLKNIEEDLKISEQQNKAMIDAIPDLIFRLSRTGEFLFYKTADESELISNDLIGKNIKEVLPEYIIEPMLNNMNLAIELEKTQLFEYNIELPKGIQYFEARLSKCGDDEILILAHNITERIKANKKIKEQELQIINALLEGQENERKRFSQELHDGLGQLLAGLKMNLNTILDDEVLNGDNIFNEVAKIANEALNEYRAISHALVSPKLEEEGLKEAILLIAQRLNSDSKIKVVCDVDELNNRLPLNVEIELFRITQELVNNAVKYSKSDRINIKLEKKNRNIIFSIEDNGVGFNIKSSNCNGIGLGNIRTRAKSIGGSFTIESNLGKGTKGIITLTI